MPSNRDFLKDKDVTFTGTGVPGEESVQLKLISYYIAIPGAVGGMAKAAQETIDPNLIESEVHGFAAIPVYGFLGAIAAVLTIAVLSDSIKKTQLKLIGISLACGLVFPTVLSSSASVIKLQTELKEAQIESNQVATRAINRLGEVGKTASNEVIKEQAIASVNEVAKTSNDTEIKEKAATAIASVGGRSENVTIQLESVEALRRLAIESNSPEVRDSVIRTLVSLSGRVDPVVKSKIGKTIEEIQKIQDERGDISESNLGMLHKRRILGLIL